MKINLKGVISSIEGVFPYITIGMGILTVIAGILIIYLVGLPIYLNTLQLPSGLNPQGLAYIATGIAFLSVGYSFIVNAIGNINSIHIKTQLDEIAQLIKNQNKVTNNENPPSTPPPCELDTSPPELDDTEIDALCKDVIRWKAAITKNEEINNIFKENPSYLFGFLTYRMMLNEKDNKKIQFSIVSLTLALTILAFGAAAMTYYQSMGKSEFPFIALIYVVISIPIFYIFLKLRPLLKNYSLPEGTKK